MRIEMAVSGEICPHLANTVIGRQAGRQAGIADRRGRIKLAADRRSLDGIFGLAL